MWEMLALLFRESPMVPSYYVPSFMKSYRTLVSLTYLKTKQY